MLETKSEGGIPCEKSSGLAMSTSTFPARFSSPAASSIAIEPAPLVAFTISSACGGGLRRRREPDLRVRLEPGLEGRVAHVVGLRSRERLLRIPGPHRHLVAELRELARERLPDRCPFP